MSAAVRRWLFADQLGPHWRRYDPGRRKFPTIAGFWSLETDLTYSRVRNGRKFDFEHGPTETRRGARAVARQCTPVGAEEEG
jgi:hypothetical protein